MKHVAKAALAAAMLLGLLSFNSGAMAEQAPRMAAEDLAAKLGAADLVVLDVRADRDWETSQAKIRGAVRQDPKDAATWAKQYDPAKLYVLYCA